MIDGIGRTIDYLRISVTDKCNLRCRYCMPEEGVCLIPHEELLTLEEIFRVVRIMEQLGIRKVRLTGGEPLVRKNLIKLVKDMNSLGGIEEISMTTNGVLFREHAAEMKTVGLKNVNFSLDTLDAARFQKITGFDHLNRVLEAVKAARALDLRVKINCVPCRELNEEDIVPLAALAMKEAVDVRFIELMPLGCGRDFHGIESDEILHRLETEYGKVTVSYEKRGNGPAKYYNFDGFSGKIGFISPMSHRFCGECNRVRLTAEGRLKLCLHYDYGIELKPLLRGGYSDDEILEQIRNAILKKPQAHDFGNESAASEQRKMVQIGG